MASFNFSILLETPPKNIKQFIITKNVGEYTANKKVSIETFFNIKFFNTKLNYESYSSMSA